MPQFFRRFGRNDVYINTIKAYPEVKFSIYSGSVYYNNAPLVSGSFTGSVNLMNSGGVGLYELNVDRFETDGQAFGPNNVENNNLIRPWISKDGNRMALRTTTEASFNSLSPGDIIYGSYPLSSSIKKNYYAADTPRSTAPVIALSEKSGLTVSTNPSVTRIRSLKNTINYNNYINPHFAYSSSAPTGSQPGARDFEHIELGLISIPSIFYGKNIKKGTVNLKFYYTGSLIGQARDTARNGVLYETSGTQVGQAIGLVLYNEGMIILTASYDLGAAGEYADNYIGTGQIGPKWVYFAQSITASSAVAGGDDRSKSSFLMEMSGTSEIQTVTMFATAPKADFNHSNNPSYVQFSTGSHVSTGSYGYIQDRQRIIKNIVSSSYSDPTGSFEKTTYISKIGIYDENENLIAIAKPATPIKKEADRDFTFKLKIDI